MSDQNDSIDVKNNQSAHRFEAQVDGGMAIADYKLSDQDIVFTHTEVPEQSRGHGVGEALAKAGLDWAHEKGLTVIPECPFIAEYMSRHGVS